MSGIGTAISVGALAAVTGIAGAAIQGHAASEAQKSQEAMFQQGLRANEKAGEQARADQQPYAQAGMGGVGGLQGYQQTGMDAMGQQRALQGLDGPEAQAAAIAQLEQSPQFLAMMRQGEDAILANASATGGLRGGNTQAALAQFRQGLLGQMVQQQLGQLGGLSNAGQQAAGGLAGLGQASAAGQAATSMASGQQQVGLLGQIGASRAGGNLAQGAAWQAGVQAPMRGVSQGLGIASGAGMGQQPSGPVL